MANREIEARLKISAIDRTGAVLAKLGERLESVNSRVEELNKRQGMVGKSANVAGEAMLKYVAPVLTADKLKDAVVDYAALERQFKRIGVTVNASDKDIADAWSQTQRVTKDMALPLQDGIDAMAVMTSSGKELKEALAFLPSMMATLQATGAQSDDVANTGLKVSDALKINADHMQNAFDIMVTGTKAGQFEFKDMAAYIPNLANSFAVLGYKGEGGLKRLVAMLQTIREDTGSAEEAATDARNIFDKMGSEETIKNFQKFGVDLPTEMAKARKNGEDTIEAFTRLSKKALGGDLTQMPLLFHDMQMKAGMQSLITSQDRFDYFLSTMNNAQVNGTVFRDLNRIIGDTQASIDRLSASWDNFYTKVGKVVAGPASMVMDYASDQQDQLDAVRAALKDRGVSNFLDWNVPNQYSKQFSDLAREGGYVPSDRPDLKELQKAVPGAYRVLGRYPQRPVSVKTEKQFDPDNGVAVFDAGEAWDARMRIQAARDDDHARFVSLRKSMSMDLDYGGSLFPRKPKTQRVPLREAVSNSTFPARPDVIPSNEPRMSDLKLGRDDGFADMAKQLEASLAPLNEGGQKIKDGADAGGQRIEQSGESFARTIEDAAARLSQAVQQIATQLANIKVNVNSAAPAAQQVNANTGRTNTFVRPTSLGHNEVR